MNIVPTCLKSTCVEVGRNLSVSDVPYRWIRQGNVSVTSVSNLTLFAWPGSNS